MTNTIERPLKTPENINLVWKHTHPDFRSGSGDKRSVMWNSGKAGTTLGPIADMPESIFLQCLKFAVRRETRAIRDKKLKPIYEKYGLLSLMQQTEQFREDMETIVEVFNSYLEPDIAKLAVNEVRDVLVPFPDAPDSDGIELFGDAVQVDGRYRGVLVLLVQRPSKQVARCFSGSPEHLWSMYALAAKNPHVIQFSFA